MENSTCKTKKKDNTNVLNLFEINSESTRKHDFCLSQTEPEKRRKEENKRVRAERDEVLETLFSAFEKHQFYTLRDLVNITQQPVVSYTGNLTVWAKPVEV